MIEGVFRKQDYFVASVTDVGEAKHLIAAEHYAGGYSNTFVYLHGLYRVKDCALLGAAQWLPPTRPAAQTVNPRQWTRVLSLSRLVVHPDVPKNAASFLLGRSIRIIRQDGKWVSLVTFACESQGHIGIIYQATNWIFVGKTKPTDLWVDAGGKQVSRLSTKTRNKKTMLSKNFHVKGRYRKNKYVMHLSSNIESSLLSLGAALQGLSWTMTHD